MEAVPALLLITDNGISVVNGFSVVAYTDKRGQHEYLKWNDKVRSVDDTADAIKWTGNYGDKITTGRLERFLYSVSFPTARTPEDSKWMARIFQELMLTDDTCVHIPYDDVHIILKHRHQLRESALEIKDVSGHSVLVALESVAEADVVLRKLLDEPLVNSVFSRSSGVGSLQMQSVSLMRTFDNFYDRFMASYLASITKAWQRFEITNFEYLMHLNSIAGRSVLDLTQYPVFPWIIADYASETLDLTNPATFRDLSKPMGALGEKRIGQFQERYRTMNELYNESDGDAAPPFFYGTHYSCSGYVLHYLMRLQPYTKYAIELQGGHFDVADRLFLSVESSWNSASRDNLQDVRELIPEFFCLPEFLSNHNDFDFGHSQKGERVHHVQLPAWAKNDPREFIRLHRAALESRYVSEHLHEWIDLIFGYKQHGIAARDAMNVFIHLTYPGAVDVDAITDPIQRLSTIAQIDNFGQTPLKLFSKAHPRRSFVDNSLRRQSMLDTSANSTVSFAGDGSLSLLGNLSPLFAYTNSNGSDGWAFGMQRVGGMVPAVYPHLVKVSKAVGDVRSVSKDKLVAVAADCIILPPLSRRYIMYGPAAAHGIVIGSTAAGYARA